MPKLTFRYYPQPISTEQAKLEKKIFKYSLFIPVLFLVIMWLIKLSETLLGTSFVELGMYPRHAKGLWGILLSPLIHGDWGHLIGNSVSFLVLSTALFFFYRKLAMPIFFINYFLSGILLWLGGRAVWHIGASGIIYGLAAFLMLSGIFRKDVRLLTISLIIIFLYGSFIWGLFPIEEGISWDGHLMGAVSGTILAAIFYKHGPPTPHYDWEDEDDDETEGDNDDENNQAVDYEYNTDEKIVFDYKKKDDL
jgi:membrane associated rhomboid family serine protease